MDAPSYQVPTSAPHPHLPISSPLCSCSVHTSVTKQCHQHELFWLFSPWAGTWRERAPLFCLVFLALTGCLAQSRLSGDICRMNKQSLLPHTSHLYKHYGYPPSMESHLSLYLTKKRRNQILLRYSRVCISPDLKKKYTHKHK